MSTSTGDPGIPVLSIHGIWITTGRRPAGDDILNPAAVASPFFGCRFTDPTPGDHPEFKGLPCPPSSR